MKKYILFLLWMFLLPMEASAEESGTYGDNIKYSYSAATNTLTISDTGVMPDSEWESHVPWWNFKDEIKSVVIEEGISKIGESNFDHLSNLESVSLPNSFEVRTSDGQTRKVVMKYDNNQ